MDNMFTHDEFLLDEEDTDTLNPFLADDEEDEVDADLGDDEEGDDAEKGDDEEEEEI